MYDASGNLVTITLPNGGVYEYGYSAGGAPLSETDALGAVTRYETDPRGLAVTAKLTPMGGRYEYEYDTLGRITGITGPEGESIHTEYSGRGEIISETDGLGRATL